MGLIVIAVSWLWPDFSSIWLGLLALALFGGALLFRETTLRLKLQEQAREYSKALLMAEEKNRLLNLTASTAKVGHWRIDLATDEIYWSPQTFAIHGLEPGIPPALDAAIEFFHPDDREIVEQSVEGSRKTGKPYTFQARLIRADGATRYTESTALVELDENGVPTALFGVFRDRTDDEIMQIELRKARDEAREMARAKTSFLTKMSHEIRTPMNGVVGFAELLSLSPLGAEQRRHVELIVESGKALQTLLNDILDLSKIEAGKFELRKERIDLPHFINRVAQTVEPMAREKSIAISSDLAHDLPQYIEIDGLRLRQILTNLLTNAVRYTDAGKVMLRVDQNGGELQFSVRDTGIGISADMLDNVFQAFTQELSDADQHRGGTGLGLTISRQLAELMGGSLTVISAEGKGSTFTLTIPMVVTSAPAEPKAPPLSAEGTPPSVYDCRVLLAEDYDINQELIRDMGRQLGLKFEIAEDGLEAVDMVIEAQTQGQPYSLVLMDLQMPKLNGIEATRAIRSAGISGAELPIIALTANAYADDIQKCLDAGMQEHLAKPLELARLRQSLQGWLGGYLRTLDGVPAHALKVVNSK